MVLSSFLIARGVQGKQQFLKVPFVAQVSDGNWVLPWSEACEEASLAMIEGYYANQSSLSVGEGKQKMQQMISWEKEIWHKDQDTNADEIMQMIESRMVFRGEVVRRPTIEQIKDEIQSGNPVVMLVNMYALYEEPSQGDSYHVAVIVGFDEDKKQFLIHDPARKAETAYTYTRVMNALHDYNASSHEADGEPTVIFTSPLHRGLSGQNFLQRVRLMMSHLF